MHKITGLPPVSHNEEAAGRQLRCIFLFVEVSNGNHVEFIYDRILGGDLFYGIRRVARFDGRLDQRVLGVGYSSQAVVDRCDFRGYVDSCCSYDQVARLIHYDEYWENHG